MEVKVIMIIIMKGGKYMLETIINVLNTTNGNNDSIFLCSYKF